MVLLYLEGLLEEMNIGVDSDLYFQLNEALLSSVRILCRNLPQCHEILCDERLLNIRDTGDLPSLKS